MRDLPITGGGSRETPDRDRPAAQPATAPGSERGAGAVVAALPRRSRLAPIIVRATVASYARRAMGRGTTPPDRTSRPRAQDAPRRDAHTQADRLLPALRLLRAAGFNGREFDQWLIALRASPATPAEAARRLGLEPRVMRPRISRWRHNPAYAPFFRRDDTGHYRLTATGATHADRAVRQLRTRLTKIQHLELGALHDPAHRRDRHHGA